MEEEIKINVNKVAKGVMIFFLGTIISKIFSYFYRIVVARYLGPEAYGILALGLGILGIASILAVFGLPTGVLRFVSFYKGKEDKEKMRGVILSSLKIGIPISIFMMILLILLRDYISLNIFNTPGLSTILFIFALLIPFVVIGSNLEYVVQAIQQVKYNVFIRQISENGLQLFLAILLITIGFGVNGAALAYALALVSSAIFFFLVLEKKLKIINQKAQSKEVSKELLSYSWPLIFSSLFSSVNLWIDSTFIGYFKGATQVGLYNAALPTSTLLTMVPGAVILMFMPIITSLYSKGENNEIKKLYNSVTKWIFLFNLPLMLILCIFSKEILVILFGGVYQQAYTSLILLSVGYFVLSFGLTSQYVLRMLSKTKLLLLNTAIVLAINVLLNILLIPRFGISGAAASVAITLIIHQIIIVIEAHKFLGVQPYSFKYINMLLSAAVIFIPLFYIKEIIHIEAILLIFVIILSYILYLILAIIFRSLGTSDKYVIDALQKKFSINLSFLNRFIK